MAHRSINVNNEVENRDVPPTPIPGEFSTRSKSMWTRTSNPDLKTPLLDQSSTSMPHSQSSSDFTAVSRRVKTLLHPPNQSFKGGEGVTRIVSARDLTDPNGKKGRDTKYWRTTLLSIRGRALPLRQWVAYILYATAVVVPVVMFVDHYQEIELLKAMQFPVNTLGTALFLLMSFRTNNCYDRWWEGCKLWFSMMFRCLDIARRAEAWLAGDDPRNAAEIIRLTIASSLVFKRWLRRQTTTLHDLYPILDHPDIKDLETAHHPVLAVCKKMTVFVKRANDKMPPIIMGGFDRQIEGIIMDALGCQRIVSTPMPFAYIVHLRSFMVVWLLALPVVFLPTIGYWTVLVCAVVAYQLLGFEDIGVEIEQPFGTDYNDLPVDQMSADLFDELLACLGKIEDVVQRQEFEAARAAAEDLNEGEVNGGV